LVEVDEKQIIIYEASCKAEKNPEPKKKENSN